jgi:hypothetical protein
MSAADAWAGDAFRATAEQRLEAARKAGNLSAIIGGLVEVNGPIPGLTELASPEDLARRYGVVLAEPPAAAEGETAVAPAVSRRDERIEKFRQMTKKQREELMDNLLAADYPASAPDVDLELDSSLQDDDEDGELGVSDEPDEEA